MMKNFLLITLLLPIFLLGCNNAHETPSNFSSKDSASSMVAPDSDKELITLRWGFSSIKEFNHLPFNKEGDVKLVDSPWGKALAFDGDGDRLLVDANPFALVGLSTDTRLQQPMSGDAFTIEVVFNPNNAKEESREPRFFHVEDANDPMRRLTLELRLNDKKQWWLDAFIKSDISNLTLIDPALVHPVEEWVHIAVTYENRTFTTYVNGTKELTGEVDFLPIAATAKTSIGARMNQIHWFDGAISEVLVANQALHPDDFLLLTKITKL